MTVGADTFMKAYVNGNGDKVIINDNVIDNTNLQPLNLQTIGGTATSTSTLSIGANLPSGANVNDQEKVNAQIFGRVLLCRVGRECAAGRADHTRVRAGGALTPGSYQTPVFGIDAQGSAGSSAAPFCRSSIESESGLRTNAMRPSRGGRLMVTPASISRLQVS